MHRLIAVILIANAFGGCASHPAQAPSAARVSLKGPSVVGSFPLAEVRQLTPSSAGVAYQYEASGFQGPDVFIYGVEGQLAGLPPDQAADRETEEFRRILPVQRMQGLFDSFSVLLDEDIKVPTEGGGVPGRHVIASLTKGTLTRYSHQILLVMYDNFVKVRITYPAALAPAARVIEFTEDLAQKLEESVPNSARSAIPIQADDRSSDPAPVE